MKNAARHHTRKEKFPPCHACGGKGYYSVFRAGVIHRGRCLYLPAIDFHRCPKCKSVREIPETILYPFTTATCSPHSSPSS